MLALENVKGIMLTIAKDAHKHVAAVPRNVEGWQDRLGKETNHPLFSFNAVLSFLY
jgi:hypothetical protein